MSKLTNLMYVALLASGDNYLQWALDTKIELKSKGLAECIVEGNEKTERSKYQAISIIRHHIAESLKNQYLTVEDPLELWLELKNRYDHQKTVQQPKAQHDWLNLRIQDYKSVEEYNSGLFKIVSILRLCGEKVTENDMLEKTFSTFHANNVLLQQQYRAKGFTTYTSLASCLLLAEKNNELLLMNSALRPPGSTAVPEANRAETAIVAVLALRGRSACLNFSDSAWRLPVPASTDPDTIRRTAAEAAEMFRPPEFSTGITVLPSASEFDTSDEGVAGMMMRLAEEPLMSPPRSYIDMNTSMYVDEEMCYEDLSLWSY